MAYKSIKEWPEDERPITEKLEAGEPLGIKMRDHIIVADGGYNQYARKRLYGWQMKYNILFLKP